MASLRDRHAELTRSAIVDAAVELFLDGDPADATMQHVADRAGVSLRTVYRYFATRRDLINAMGRRVDERFAEEAGGSNLPDTLDALVEGTSGQVEHGVRERELLRRSLLVSIPGGEWYADRDDHIWDVFRHAFPHLPEDEARADFALLRHVLSAANVILVGERFGLDPTQLADAMARAGRALRDAAADRDREAAGQPVSR